MNYQDDIPLAKRIRSIKTLSNKSFLRLGLLLVGLSISLSFLANKSFLRQTKSLDNAISSSKTKQNKSLLGHLPYPEASKNELLAKKLNDIEKPTNRSPKRKKDLLERVLMDLILLASGMSS